MAPGLISFSWVPLVTGLKRYALEMLAIGLLLLLLAALAFFGFSYLEGIHIYLAWVVEAFLLVCVLFLSIRGLFLPVMIASSLGHRKQSLINVLNALFLIPFCWLVALILACKRSERGTNESEQSRIRKL